MNYLKLDDVLAIACEVLGLEVDALMHVTGLGLADSALAQPQAGFAEVEFHPSIDAKAAALSDRCLRHIRPPRGQRRSDSPTAKRVGAYAR